MTLVKMGARCPEVLKIVPKQFSDARGFFAEVFHSEKYLALGIKDNFVQDNQSLSHSTNTIRGLHFQAPPFAQGKLVRCGRGAIFDVAVDIRRGSPNFGKWDGFELTAENGHQLYIPVGFAHGFVTLEPNSEILYKCTEHYSPETEAAVRWDSCGIDWPLSGEPILSEKDAVSPSLSDIVSPFIYGENS